MWIKQYRFRLEENKGENRMELKSEIQEELIQKKKKESKQSELNCKRLRKFCSGKE